MSLTSSFYYIAEKPRGPVSSIHGDARHLVTGQLCSCIMLFQPMSSHDWKDMWRGDRCSCSSDIATMNDVSCNDLIYYTIILFSHDLINYIGISGGNKVSLSWDFKKMFLLSRENGGNKIYECMALWGFWVPCISVYHWNSACIFKIKPSSFIPVVPAAAVSSLSWVSLCLYFCILAPEL